MKHIFMLAIIIITAFTGCKGKEENQSGYTTEWPPEKLDLQGRDYYYMNYSRGETTVIDGTTLYVLEQERGVRVFDISSPGSVTQIGTYDFDGELGHLHFIDGHLLLIQSLNLSVAGSDGFLWWLGVSSSTLHILDIQDPANILQVSSTPLAGRAHQTGFAGDIFYVLSARGEECVTCEENFLEIQTFVPHVSTGFLHSDTLNVALPQGTFEGEYYDHLPILRMFVGAEQLYLAVADYYGEKQFFAVPFDTSTGTLSAKVAFPMIEARDVMGVYEDGEEFYVLYGDGMTKIQAFIKDLSGGLLQIGNATVLSMSPTRISSVAQVGHVLVLAHITGFSAILSRVQFSGGDVMLYADTNVDVDVHSHIIKNVGDSLVNFCGNSIHAYDATSLGEEVISPTSSMAGMEIPPNCDDSWFGFKISENRFAYYANNNVYQTAHFSVDQGVLSPLYLLPDGHESCSLAHGTDAVIQNCDDVVYTHHLDSGGALSSTDEFVLKRFIISHNKLTDEFSAQVHRNPRSHHYEFVTVPSADPNAVAVSTPVQLSVAVSTPIQLSRERSFDPIVRERTPEGVPPYPPEFWTDCTTGICHVVNDFYFYAIDMSDPSTPILFSTLFSKDFITKQPFPYYESVVRVKESLLTTLSFGFFDNDYIDNESHLVAINYADPANPEISLHLITPKLYAWSTPLVRGEKAYLSRREFVTDDDKEVNIGHLPEVIEASHWLKVIDFSDPFNVLDSAEVNIPGDLIGLNESASLLYVLDKQRVTHDLEETIDTLHIVPFDGEQIGTYTSVDLIGGTIIDILPHGERIAVLYFDHDEQEYRLRSVDISDPANPVLGNPFSIPIPNVDSNFSTTGCDIPINLQLHAGMPNMVMLSSGCTPALWAFNMQDVNALDLILNERLKGRLRKLIPGEEGVTAVLDSGGVVTWKWGTTI
jgi:6-phosphogluconolactonase (cycloisomerase 2 family)